METIIVMNSCQLFVGLLLAVLLAADVAVAKPLLRRPLTLSALESRFSHATAALPLHFGGALPASIDWRKKGYIATPVDSGECGAAELGAALATNIAGVSAVKNGRFIGVSVEEIVSCAIGGCDVQVLDFAAAYSWFMAHTDGHVVSNDAQPFTGNAGACNTTGATAAHIVAFRKLSQDEKTMASFVANFGPIAAGIYGVPLETYMGGILSAADCGTSPVVDSAVAIVGYDMDSTPPYWIVQNAWGSAWGEDGYARIEFGKNACAIATFSASAFAGLL